MQKGQHKVWCSTELKVTIIKICSNFFKIVSEEFQASLSIRRKTMPLSSAKDDLQQYLQP
jgi:hypothetical protein